MRNRMISCLLAGLAMMSGASAYAGDNLVSIDQGQLQGVADGASISYRGIPYAAAPVGDNRWRAPQAAPHWDGIRNAGTFGPDCNQSDFENDVAKLIGPHSEDCLFVNVWTPEGAKPGAKLPVMVWVHGGGFVNGGSSPDIYSGRNFARDGVVFVSLNYRLGRFGFFAHPALMSEGYGGNFGFLDQIAALKWVQHNIAAFGGDADNVTLFGESAGGISMQVLLQSPLARGLFDRVIIESGGGRNNALPMKTMAEAALEGQRFAPGLNAAELRALPAEKLTGDLSMSTILKQTGYSGPMFDGRTAFGKPLTAAEAGLYAKVPVIIGANSADGLPILFDKDEVFALYGEYAEEARAVYDPDGQTPGGHVAFAVSADYIFIEPARAMARMLADKQLVWLYRFDHAPDIVAAYTGGAPHASEIPYAFDTLAARTRFPASDADRKVARLMHRYWVNFAKTGRPDGKGVPAWPIATENDVKLQIIDADGARHADDPLTGRLDFVEKRAELVRNR